MDQVLEQPHVLLAGLAEALSAGEVVPYLGPGISALAELRAPMTPEALADFFAGKTALPRRARGNCWAAAQYIENYRFRDTVTLWMKEAYAAPVAPSAFHRWLAGLPLPLVVDAWYTGEMRRALAGRGDWAEVQGITRAGIGEDRWFRFYDAQGRPADAATAAKAATLLYSPHGSVDPDANFLISDADYVEVLTEIDIQTPIPEDVRNRRTGKTFLFLGCRFHDQLLRTYARQVMKRSAARHYAVVEFAKLTRNERRFLDEQGIVPIDLPLAEALATLIAPGRD
ncbi:SIR2 family NAD-dependent protein deacylase [Novosphingobium album (ex Liu et al. 2023)]|uniref:SIR2 family protein n=1 Tax=Novosphingobium album (ex Liu et al. 2023) TaxID=3031130 RepID=A0ABT5WQA0_9SPHN|nr:SIR2 family protein [Novosphingobium album (ex Liu et al. 2023)]MDE8652217.1 SIR2 family protein [Novosphingobium album (ex Liu et al. 2023)]